MPTVLGGIGVLIIAIGIYILNTMEGSVSPLDPFRTLKSDRGARMMFAVSAIYSVTANFDYLAMVRANEAFYLVAVHVLMSMLCLALAVVYRATGRVEAQDLSPSGAWLALVAFGFMVALMVIPHMLAFRFIPNVPYVIVTKRAGFMVFAVLMAIWLGVSKRFSGEYRDEASNLKYRIPGIIVMFIGMTLIILYGQAA